MRDFVAGYCDNRFGESWHLSPDQSLLLRSGERTLPRQLQVTADLIEKVRNGTWDPEGADRQQRDAMAAKGYFETYKLVKDLIAKTLRQRAKQVGAAAGLIHSPLQLARRPAPRRPRINIHARILMPLAHNDCCPTAEWPPSVRRV